MVILCRREVLRKIPSLIRPSKSSQHHWSHLISIAVTRWYYSWESYSLISPEAILRNRIRGTDGMWDSLGGSTWPYSGRKLSLGKSLVTNRSPASVQTALSPLQTLYTCANVDCGLQDFWRHPDPNPLVRRSLFYAFLVAL